MFPLMLRRQIVFLCLNIRLHIQYTYVRLTNTLRLHLFSSFTAAFVVTLVVRFLLTSRLSAFRFVSIDTCYVALLLPELVFLDYHDGGNE